MINKEEIRRLHALGEARGVPYHLGAKPPRPTCSLGEITTCDCSGWVRWLLTRAGAEDVPDGSWHIAAWAGRTLRPLAQYADVRHAAKDPSRIFLAYIPPQENTPGHVWLVCAGKTLECRSRAGVSSRAWNARPLRRLPSYAWEVA